MPFSSATNAPFSSAVDNHPSYDSKNRSNQKQTQDAKNEDRRPSALLFGGILDGNRSNSWRCRKGCAAVTTELGVRRTLSPTFLTVHTALHLERENILIGLKIAAHNIEFSCRPES